MEPGGFARTSITSETKTATGATYDPAAGTLVITSNGHGFSNGDFVQIVDGSLTFECDLDSRATQHTYPREDDPISDRFIEISGVTTNNFTLNVGVSSNTSTHYFISASANGIIRTTGTITVTGYFT